ncbi:hypothetical protein HDK90DRAFT_464452 [Phyllosticta capitalensis]|uniref:DUF6604 domain-containing protein n=2 Tax=Phyllosticta capitalensis TaxID=121624 RepID=A0ABR1YRH3_9PEZI
MFPKALRSVYFQYKEDTDAVASWLAVTARSCGYSGDLLDKSEDVPASQTEPPSQTSDGKAKDNRESSDSCVESEPSQRPNGNVKHPRESSEPHEQSEPSQRSNGKTKHSRESSEPHANSKAKDVRESSGPHANGKTRHPRESSEPRAQSLKPYKIISTRAFPILAKFIAESTPPVTAPPLFVHTLDRAIALRKKFADTGSRITSFRKTFATENHQHFVSALEEVREIIGERVAADVEDSTSPPPESSDGLDAKLPSEESEEFLDASDIAVESDLEYKADQFEDPEELDLAFKLLAEDFANIRNTVTKLWKRYTNGTMRIIAPALATNTAIDIARRLELDITQVLEKHGGFEKVYNERWLQICQRRGKSWEHREQSGDEINFELYKDADKFMFPTYLTMRAFLPLVQSDPKSTCFNKTGTWGEIDRNSNWNTMRARKKFQSDKALLMEILTASTALIRLGDPKGLTAEDEFIRGLRTMIETGKICFWNILSAQILLDIHHCLRKDIDRPFWNLHQVGLHLKCSVENNRKEFKDIGHARWNQSKNRPFTEIWEMVVRFIHNDDLRNTMLRSGNEAFEEHFILKNNPVFCGLFQYALQMRFHVVSIDFVNAYGVILATRHLYNTFKHEKLLSREWEDMRKLERLQRDQPAFKSKPPANKRDHWESYIALHTGDPSTRVPRSFYRMFQHETTLVQDGLKYQADLARLFMHRYCDGSGRVDFTPDELKKILLETATYEEAKGVKRSVKVWGQKMYMSGMMGKLERKEMPGRAQLIRRLTVPELLERFASSLDAETGLYELNFNYLHLHSICWGMLQSLSRFDREIHRRFGDRHEFLGYEFELAGLVGFYMLDFNEEPPESELCYAKSIGRDVSRLHLLSAAVWEGALGSTDVGRLQTQVLEREFNLWAESDCQ